jgi:hypothetical protein
MINLKVLLIRPKSYKCRKLKRLKLNLKGLMKEILAGIKMDKFMTMISLL